MKHVWTYLNKDIMYLIESQAFWVAVLFIRFLSLSSIFSIGCMEDRRLSWVIFVDWTSFLVICC